jgi:exonuclease III
MVLKFVLVVYVIVIYRPPRNNLSKFKEIMDKAQKFIEEQRTQNIEANIVLTGDFNFPPDIVKWKRAGHVVFPDPCDGITNQKQAYHILQDFADEFNLDQLVDKPTRERNTLDLVYTDCPRVFLSLVGLSTSWSRLNSSAKSWRIW